MLIKKVRLKEITKIQKSFNIRQFKVFFKRLVARFKIYLKMMKSRSYKTNLHSQTQTYKNESFKYP